MHWWRWLEYAGNNVFTQTDVCFKNYFLYLTATIVFCSRKINQESCVLHFLCWNEHAPQAHQLHNRKQSYKVVSNILIYSRILHRVPKADWQNFPLNFKIKINFKIRLHLCHPAAAACSHSIISIAIATHTCQIRAELMQEPLCRNLLALRYATLEFTRISFYF